MIVTMMGTWHTMEMTEKLKNILSSDKWFHATTKSNYDSICKMGVVADFNRGKELDFGYGFYLTSSEKLAEGYLCRLYDWLDSINDTLVIMEYTFKPLEWFASGLYNATIFESFDDRFAEFVFMNRLECKTNKQRHNYDVIYGVMSDSVPTQLLLNYRAGDIDKEAVLNGLKRGNSMKQLSIHNQTLCDSIILTRAYEFDPKTQERKELDLKNE